MTSTREGIFLFVTILIITAVGYLLYREKKLRKYATIFSILGIGLTLRIFVSLDPYLHEWDEKYHALVGKNLTTGVKEPALFATPVHDYDFRKWTANHIWLEKGPIPLLLIGYSAKVFGYSELSVRIPSIILGTLSILLTFLIARKLFTTQTAYYASFLHSINGLIIELNGGRISSDHVESLFIITVEISFYVMLIFFERKTNRGALAFLFGISIGFSILTKWAPALLPFLVFCFVLIVKEKRPFYFARKYGFRAILGITIIVAPYFLYLHASYPTEFEWVLKKFLLAYNNTVELHQGEWWYYINKIGVVFGETCIIVLLITLFVTIKKRDWRFILLSLWWVLPVLIFSLAQTKRATYILIAAPAVFILVGYSISFLIKFKNIFSLKETKIFLNIVIISLITLPLLYSFERVKPFDSNFTSPDWIVDIENMKKLQFPAKKTIILSFPHNIEAMFYTEFTVYTDVFPTKKIDQLISENYNVIYFDSKSSSFKAYDKFSP